MTTGFSLANLSVADAGPLELIDAAAAAGFDAVNMWLTPPPGAKNIVKVPSTRPVIGDAELIDAIRQRSAATGVRVAQASCGWLGQTFSVALARRVFDTLSQLGVRRFTIVGWDPDHSRFVHNLGSICTLATDASINVSLEFMPYSSVRSLADALKIVDAVRWPCFDLIIDALHLARSGGHPDDLRGVDPKRLGVVQICDALAQAPQGPQQLADESRNQRLHPGDGALPLRKLIAALPSEIELEVEVPCAADASLSIEERAKRCADRARAFLTAQQASTPSS